MVSVHDALRHDWARRRRSTVDNNSTVENGGSYIQFKCGGDATKRQLNMKDCTHHCERNYYLYLPSAACAGDNVHLDNRVDSIGTLPLVFAVHCLGCTPMTMMHWTEIAETYHFVLAIPEGLENSFNGQHCCGYALDQGVDDVGFLQAIIQELDQQFHFVSSSLVYALGWSNGGYLVSYAAKLFRAIAPISGYQVDITPAVKRPTAIFLHHAQNDNFVRITGCCTNASMPRCCCQLSTFTDTCTSAEQKMQEWASPSINDCRSSSSSSGQTYPAVTQPQITINKPDSVTCYTYLNCLANTTYCIHKNKGHFNRPSFEASFPMATEIADFFARHACQTGGGGQWTKEEEENQMESRCVCQAAPGSNGKKYCHTPDGNNTLSLPTSSLSTLAAGQEGSAPGTVEYGVALLSFILIAVGLLLALYYYSSSRRRTYKGFDKVSTVELRSL